MSYTRDREARRRRLKERGELDAVTSGRRGIKRGQIKCETCGDLGYVIVQSSRDDPGGQRPCPSCQRAG